MARVPRFLVAYNNILHRRPFLVISITTGVINVLGDALAQHGVEHTKKHDYIRSSHFLLLGTAFAPLVYSWIRFLNNSVHGSPIMKTLKSMLIDQTCMSPLLLANFFLCINLLRGKSFEEIQGIFRNDYFPILLNNWKIWPPAQIINFYLIPVNYRVIFSSLVSLGWNAYLSYATRPQGHAFPILEK